MSYPTHLIKVKSRFYYKIKVPADLAHFFPSQFIKKSLHTNNLGAAKTMLRCLEFKTHNAFALLRTGTLMRRTFAIYITGHNHHKYRCSSIKYDFSFLPAINITKIILLLIY